MSEYVKRLWDARNWFNDGQCCGQLDSSGTCAAPACIFGEALKEFHRAAERIEKLEAALQEIEYLDRPQVRGMPRRKTIQQIALDALAGVNDDR